MNNKLNISIIGVGHLGGIHTKVLSQNSSINFVGTYDIIRERSESAFQNYNCPVFENLESAIENSDALIIAVPTSVHNEVAKKCILAKKHCFIEKPITDNYHSALELLELAKSFNVKLQVGHIERFNPALLALDKFELKPLFIEAHRLGQFKPRARDVSVLHDLMIHDIDIVLQMVNSEIKNISANGVNVLTDTTDIANARITFCNGTVANLTASRISANQMRKMRIFQKDAYISIDFAEHTTEVFKIIDSDLSSQFDGQVASMLGSIETGSKNRNIYYLKPEVFKSNAIDAEQKSFFDSIQNNTPIKADAESATEALRVAEIILDEIHKNQYS